MSRCVQDNRTGGGFFAVVSNALQALRCGLVGLLCLLSGKRPSCTVLTNAVEERV